MNDRYLWWKLAEVSHEAGRALWQRRSTQGLGPDEILMRLKGRWDGSRQGKDRIRRKAGMIKAIESATPTPVPDNVVVRGDGDYPDALYELDDPPFALWTWGDRSVLASSPTVGIIGSRRPRAGARSWAGEVGYQLGRAGCVVVSGLALGVDGVAHRSVVTGGGTCMAILGSGIDNIYPPENVGLARDIVDGGGLIVSEYPPHAGARRYTFPERNRLIAALSSVLVVVQAGMKSGTRHTIDAAREIGRDVLVLPASMDDPAFAGSRQALRDGASVVIDAETVFEQIGVPWSPLEVQVPFNGILDQPRTPEDIADLTKRPVHEVMAELSVLEIDGEVRRLPDGSYGPCGTA